MYLVLCVVLYSDWLGLYIVKLNAVCCICTVCYILYVVLSTAELSRV